MDKLTAILHLPGRQPVEVEIMISDVLAVDGPGNIRFTIEPKGFTFGVDQVEAVPDESDADDGPPAPPRQPGDITPAFPLTGDPYNDYPLIAKRFPWLADTLPAQYLKPGLRPVDQLSQDVDRLVPIADTLRRGDKWNQSAIAQELGWPNTGGSYRRRILDIISELERRAA